MLVHVRPTAADAGESPSDLSVITREASSREIKTQRNYGGRGQRSRQATQSRAHRAARVMKRSRWGGCVTRIISAVMEGVHEEF